MTTEPDHMVWVTIGSNRGYRVRYHYSRSCWLHKDKVAHGRIPTMESYAQLAGLTPCRSCVPHGA